MSTFNGVISEFPDIRIDFFRGLETRPALACFLSHVHSDHLTGLDTLKSPFVYCSAATREILLRLERYPCRINYALGILEAREQTYRHLTKVLKPLPLDTPTQIELGPQKSIQVTLIDANHCVGAVMFLVEDEQTAILYTGDIRAEPWWVNSIARNPCLIEYTTGLRRLERIYLDTSMLDDVPLQTKAEGLRELIVQVCQYPLDTVFCMQAWTYGYEEVWIALARALKSKIHVDRYKMRIYKSLVCNEGSGKFLTQTYLSKDAPALVGFTCGNHQLDGCLTLDEGVRIHSCEKGTPCKVMQGKPVVWIKPIVAHLKDGKNLLEIGVGGGGGDLNKEAELPALDEDDMNAFLEMAAKEHNISRIMKEDFEMMLQKSTGSLRSLAVNMDISAFTDDFHADLKGAIQAMVYKVETLRNPTVAKSPQSLETRSKEARVNTKLPASRELPDRISFPYARHSSLPELRHLVRTFRPNDVWPCTVDARDWEKRGISMRWLFGRYCSGDKEVFEHDEMMDVVFKDLQDENINEVAEEESVQGRRSRQSSSSIPSHSSPLPQSTPVHNLMDRAPLVRSELPPQHQASSQELGRTPRWKRPPKRPISASDSAELSNPQIRFANHRLAPSEGDKTPQPAVDGEAENDSPHNRGSTSPLIRYASAHIAPNHSAEVRMPMANPLLELHFKGVNIARNDIRTGTHEEEDKDHTPAEPNSQISTISISSTTSSELPAPDPEGSLDARTRAFRAAEECIFGETTWPGSASGFGLISTTDNHSTIEVELGTSYDESIHVKRP